MSDQYSRDPGTSGQPQGGQGYGQNQGDQGYQQQSGSGQAQSYGGQSHGNNQPYGNQYGDQQYGQSNSYAQSPPLYGQQGYAQPYAYETQPQEKSKTLGMIGLGVVVVCAIIMAVLGYMFGQAYGQFMVDAGLDPQSINQTELQNDPRFIAFTQQLGGIMGGTGFVALAGLAGWIISIVATAQRRGRAFGIWGIILGILAPILWIIAVVLGMMPALQTIA